MKVIAHYTLSGTANYAVLTEDELAILETMAADSVELDITKVEIYRGR